MAFLLGSFTDGLFGGAKDVMSIANDWETLKQKRMETKRQKDLMDAGDQVKSALKAGQTAEKGAAAASSGTTSTPAPEKYVEPDFSTLPTPKWMSDKVTREALPLLPKGSPDNPSEGKARLKPTKSNSKDADVLTNPVKRAFFNTGNQPGSPNNPFTADIPVAEAPIPAAGAALPTPAAPTQPATPGYLPPGAPGSPGSTWALPPAAQQSAIGNPMPNLASNQIGLGPRILAALNPAAGSTG